MDFALMLFEGLISRMAVPRIRIVHVNEDRLGKRRERHVLIKKERPHFLRRFLFLTRRLEMNGFRDDFLDAFHVMSDKSLGRRTSHKSRQ